MAHTIQNQDEVLAFLGDPATHGGAAVRRIDTHAAAVFLAGPRALKIKRAVRFAFLDYGSLDKREAACRAELAVNRHFAPALYLGVIPIVRRKDGALALGGDGEVVEWALEMRRFNEDATLDRHAMAHGIDNTLADRLGHIVADAHRSAPIAASPQWISSLSDYIDQNEAELGSAPDLFAPDEVRKLCRASRDLLGIVRPLLQMRGEMGLVRRSHGDLHLGNIALIDGAPVLFDALEIERLATSDLLYDLAFLLMDLVERELPAAANIVLNRYLTGTARAEDFDALKALPLFLSLRAAIRAKVTAARRETAASENRDEIGKQAKAYFRFALQAIAPTAPRLLAVGGLSGSGKSALARALAPDIAPIPGAVILRSDVMRKRLFGKSETEKLPQEAYAPGVTQQLYRLLVEQAARVVKAGHSAIADAVFAHPQERQTIEAAARACGVEFHGLFLVTDLATRMRRVNRRRGDASDADAKVAEMQEAYDLGPLDWAEVDSSGAVPETLAHAKAALQGG